MHKNCFVLCNSCLDEVAPVQLFFVLFIHSLKCTASKKKDCSLETNDKVCPELHSHISEYSLGSSRVTLETNQLKQQQAKSPSN